jgi:DNA polymerase-3 subunit alpha
LDSFGERNALMNSVDLLLQFSKEHDHGKKMHQTDLFSVMEDGAQHQGLTIKKAALASWFQKLQWEKETLGMYVSDHPLRGLREYLKRKVTLIREIKPSMNKRMIRIGGIVNEMKKVVTKRGETMMVLELEDLTGKMTVIVFPRVYAQIKDSDLFEKEEYFVLVEGRIDYRDGELQCIASAFSKASIKSMRENAMQEGFFNPNETRFTPVEIHEEKTEPDVTRELPTSASFHFRLHDHVKSHDLKTIREIMERHPGETPVVLNVLLEGHRQDIHTGIRTKIDDPNLKKELLPFLKE